MLKPLILHALSSLIAPGALVVQVVGPRLHKLSAALE